MYSSKASIITAEAWPDYQLIDFGNGKRLERFGKHVLIRPDVNALDASPANKIPWEKQAHANFKETSSSKGTWVELSGNFNPSEINLPQDFQLKCSLKKGPYKHLGIFPEQVSNWHFIKARLEAKKLGNPKVLNLFAYTGLASLVAKKYGADVTHVDSSKSVINWANENQEINELDGIRWCVEDAILFLKKELKRGRKYHGVIMDPPAFGISGNKKRWKLEQQITELIENAVKILDSEFHFLVLNTYSPRVDAAEIKKQLISLRGKRNLEAGKLCLISQSDKLLPTGNLFRFYK